MTNPNMCKRCDSMDRSCCTLRAENNEGLPAPVSGPEIKKILNLFKDKKRSDFLDKRINSPQFIGQMSILFPDMAESINNVFPVDGSHFDLKTQEDACIFKDANGCLLPDDARPLFCRIYPFWFFDDKPNIFQDPNCLALENCQTISEVVLCLGTKPERLKQIHGLICENWGLHHALPREKKSRLIFS
ncbi:MAG: hypothetical protein GY710_06745 [Desulfobacteraceae bacterium]|nr:hypothetical protein [Desulfobacteraceae bacterium]